MRGLRCIRAWHDIHTHLSGLAHCPASSDPAIRHPCEISTPGSLVSREALCSNLSRQPLLTYSFRYKSTGRRPQLPSTPQRKSLDFVYHQLLGLQVVIDWDAGSKTALFIWRGSITEQDWLQVRLSHNLDSIMYCTFVMHQEATSHVQYKILLSACRPPSSSSNRCINV